MLREALDVGDGDIIEIDGDDLDEKTVE